MDVRGGEQAERAFRRHDAEDLPVHIVAAHELKAPLALIRQLALEIESDSAAVPEIAEQIRLVSERSLRLTSDMTKAMHVQTLLFPTDPIDVRGLCVEVTREMSTMYRAHGMKLRYRGSAKLPLAASHHDLLRRIVLNFTDNALHYADEDGVVELYTQLLKKRGKIRVGVRDYGPALPMNIWRSVKEHAFSSQPVSARPGSSGLGLQIASKFAVMIHGQIGAIRHQDGATFYVDVPLSKQLGLL